LKPHSNTNFKLNQNRTFFRKTPKRLTAFRRVAEEVRPPAYVATLHQNRQQSLRGGRRGPPGREPLARHDGGTPLDARHQIRPSGGMSNAWQVAVFCHNERGRIASCLASVAASIGTRPGLITLLLNGSTDGSEAAALAARAGLGVELQIFTIPHADKSNAINVFLHELRTNAGLYAFVDGSVTIGREAIAAAEARLAACPDALAASGVAGNGRTETRTNRAAVERGGILRGQFFALRPAFVERMVAAGIRLPVGLYRGDGLLGSMAAHDLDPPRKPWENGRVIGVAEGEFDIDALSPFRLRDLRRLFARKIRQIRGPAGLRRRHDRGFPGPSSASRRISARPAVHGLGTRAAPRRRPPRSGRPATPKDRLSGPEWKCAHGGNAGPVAAGGRGKIRQPGRGRLGAAAARAFRPLHARRLVRGAAHQPGRADHTLARCRLRP
jgi:hypothetical protein